MDFSWSLIVDLGIIAGSLLLATFLRVKIVFFQKYLIPNALTAGFIILPYYNFLAPYHGIDTHGLGTLVYHLLNIAFIAMTLRILPVDPAAKKRGNIFAHSTGTLSQYAIQAVTGLVLVMVFIKTIFPSLNPGFGFLLPLGFALGPGQAYAIGQGWERLGFEGASSLGLTFAAIGFLWGCFGGVFLMNYGIRKGWIEKEFLHKIYERSTRSGILSKEEQSPCGTTLTTDSEAIDSLTYHAALIFFIYLFSFLLLKLVTWLLGFIGPMGQQFAESLWGINFIFSALTAMVFRELMKLFKISHTIDNATLTRVSGLSIDLMITAAIGAISLVVVKSFWLPILLTTLVGGLLTLITTPWLCSRLFSDHRFHRTIMIYGASTGTMPTGLSLLRAMDPEFETPVATEYMFSSGITFSLAIPLILVVNYPTISKLENNPLLFMIALGVSICYVIYVTAAFLISARKRAFARSRQLWLEDKKVQE
ncbi:MAG: sodium:glutamate symporter [Spirochaetales bacterium]|nr:sodium:glutamate symporter [Spirochaetales bacterium]